MKFTLPLPRQRTEPHRLKLSTLTSAPSFKLNGEELTAHRKDWIEICQGEENASITFKLVEASYASVGFGEVVGRLEAGCGDKTGRFNSEAQRRGSKRGFAVGGRLELFNDLDPRRGPTTESRSLPGRRSTRLLSGCKATPCSAAPSMTGPRHFACREVSFQAFPSRLHDTSRSGYAVRLSHFARSEQ